MRAYFLIDAFFGGWGEGGFLAGSIFKGYKSIESSFLIKKNIEIVSKILLCSNLSEIVLS